MKIQESFLPSFPFFHLLLHWVRQPFLGIPPFISDPGSLCLFLYLDMYCMYMLMKHLIVQPMGMKLYINIKIELDSFLH